MKLILLLFIAIIVFTIANSVIVEESGNVKSAQKTITRAVGRLQTEVNVAQGSFSYSVPIEVPPGLVNFEPSLSINYGSHSEGGLVGKKWDLIGISQVERCHVSKRVYGYKSGIQFNENDQFCLDGMKLVPLSTFQTNTEYRTNKEIWAKITSSASTNSKSTIASFKVIEKSGNIKHYRHSVFVNNNGAYLRWMISKEIDLNGNVIIYKYDQKGRVTQIEYSGNPDQTLPTSRFIKFTYEALEAPVTKYVAGVDVTQKKRLSLISTFVGDLQVLQYRLNYQNDLLQSIFKCAGTSDECFTISINWNSIGTSVPETGGWGKTQFQPLSKPLSKSIASFQLEVNGDARLDILDLGSDDGKTIGANVYSAPYNTKPQYTFLSGLKGAPTYNERNQFFALDISGDGITNLVQIWQTKSGSSGVHIYSYFMDNTGRFTSVKEFIVRDFSFDGIANVIPGDFNGDGKADLAIAVGINLIVLLSNGDGTYDQMRTQYLYYDTTKYAILPVDANGDGLTDLITFSGDSNIEVYVQLNDPRNLGVFQKGFTTNTFIQPNDKITYKFTDVNGDGNQDILIIDESSSITITPFLSNGNGSFSMSKAITLYMSDTVISITCGDVNSDHMDDIIIVTKQPDNYMFSYVLLSYGDSYNSQYSYQRLGVYQITPKILFYDFIGNGRIQMIFSEPDALNMFESLFYSPPKVTSFDEGYGRLISVQYDYISMNSEIYTPSQKSYPLKTSTIPFHVVSKYSRQDTNTNTEYSYWYKYEGIAIDLETGAFLGFQKITEEDDLGIVIIREINQQYPLENVPITTSTYCNPAKSKDPKCSGQSLILLSKDVHLTQSIKGYSNLEIWQIEQQKSILYNYHYGILSGVSSVEFTYDIPSFGEVKSKIVINNDTNPTSINTSKDPHNIYYEFEYYNDVQRNILGYVTYSKVSDVNGNILNQKKQTYDTTTMNLISTLEWKNDTNSWITQGYKFDKFGNIIQEIAPNGGITKYIYSSVDPVFIQSTISPPNQHGMKLISNYTYDARFGEVTSVTDENGVTMSTAYDGFGRPTIKTGPNLNDDTTTIWMQSYSAVNNAIYVQTQHLRDWDSNLFTTTTQYFDAFDRDIASEETGFQDSLIIRQESFYDAADRVIKSSTPKYTTDSSPTLYILNTYDAYGRLIQSVDPDGVKTTVNYLSGFEWIVTSADGSSTPQTVHYNSQLFNGEQKTVSVQYENDQLLGFRYSVLGEQTSVYTKTNGTVITLKTTQFDSLSNIVKKSVLSAGTVSYVYDKSTGQLTTKYNAMSSTVPSVIFSYDQLNRVTTKTIQSADMKSKRTITYNYDDPSIFSPSESKLYGQISSITEQISSEGQSSMITHKFAYDAYSNVIIDQSTVDSKDYITKRSFSPLGDPVMINFPDGIVMKQTYTANGLNLEYFVDNKMHLSYPDYNANNEHNVEQCGNGVSKTTLYDRATGLLKEIQITKGAASLYHTKIDYNDLRLVSNVGNSNPANLESFNYDGLSQLVKAVGPYGDLTYEYDELGNLRLKDGILYKYNGYQPVEGYDSTGKLVFSAKYDAAGKLIQKTDSYGTWEYIYNEQQRLSGVKKNGILVVSYEYDFVGRRIKRKSANSGMSRTYVSPIYEVTSNDESSKLILQGRMEAPKVEVLKDQAIYYHSNNVENNVVVTTSTGTIKNITYKPYGEDMENDDDIRFKFSGREWDPEARLYYFKARYYDPSIGRFISADTTLGGDAEIVTSYNRYAYVLNNPANFVDPTGHSVWSAIAGLVISAVEIVAGVAVEILSGGSLTIVAQGLIGSGTSGLLYTATHFNNYNWRDFAIEEAIGGISGALFAGVGSALSKTGGAFRAAAKTEASLLGEEAIAAKGIGKSLLSGCNCFTKDTKVFVQGGLKSIESVQIGDLVYAFNGTSVQLQPVIAKFKRFTNKILRMELYQCADPSRRSTLYVTIEHEIFVVKKGYVSALSIGKEDILADIEGNQICIASKKVEEMNAEVYNLEVKDSHNFFVSDAKILVHNVKCTIPTKAGSNWSGWGKLPKHTKGTNPLIKKGVPNKPGIYQFGIMNKAGTALKRKVYIGRAQTGLANRLNGYARNGSHLTKIRAKGASARARRLLVRSNFVKYRLQKRLVFRYKLTKGRTGAVAEEAAKLRKIKSIRPTDGDYFSWNIAQT